MKDLVVIRLNSKVEENPQKETAQCFGKEEYVNLFKEKYKIKANQTEASIPLPSFYKIGFELICVTLNPETGAREYFLHKNIPWWQRIFQISK